MKYIDADSLLAELDTKRKDYLIAQNEFKADDPELASFYEGKAKMCAELSNYINYKANSKMKVKQTISQNQAGALLLKSVDSGDFEDRIYDFAMELCNDRIYAIESKYNIVGNDGSLYTDEENICWYDEYRDDFLKAVFERIKEMI